MIRKNKPQAQEISQKEFPLLLKKGIHFGHKKSRWHPSMAPYIYGKRGNIYIIDVAKTEAKLQEALDFIHDLTKQGKQIIFIGTKPNVKRFLESFAAEHNLLYITNRWIGGTLTNFKVLQERVRYFNELKKKTESPEFEEYPKKERREIEKKIESLSKKWAGLKGLKEKPAALFLLDVPSNYLAIKEAKATGVKIIAICDTDADIRQIDYPIPANDDALPAVEYILEKTVKAMKVSRKADPEKKEK